MDTNTLLVIILLLVIFILLLVIGLLFFYLIVKNKDQSKNNDKPVNFKELLKQSKQEDKIANGICNICEKELYDGDHIEVEKLHFCREHFDTYSENKWSCITNQKTTAETSEAGVYIYNFKKDMWDNKKAPMYIQCEYKIDITNDHIETYVQLYTLEKDAKAYKEQLEKNIK